MLSGTHTGLKAGFLGCFPPCTVLAPPGAWPQWDSDTGTDPAEKQIEDQRKDGIFLIEKEQLSEGNTCLSELLVQVMEEVQL